MFSVRGVLVGEDLRAAKTYDPITMKRLIMTVALAGTGCSAIFMERLPDGFDVKKSEPRCTASGGFAAWDGLQAVGWGIAAVALFLSAESSTSSQGFETSAGNDNAGIGIIAAGLGLAHVASAVKGGGWAADCRLAREQRGPAALQLVEKPVEKPAIVIAPRGFYCTSNEALGTCSREKAACEQARGAMLAAAADLGACVLLESAWCFDSGRCAPTQAICEGQSTGGACLEAR